MKNILILMAVVILAGCSSHSPYTYHENPTTLKKGETQYFVKTPVVKLTLGHGAISGDTSFVSQDVLAKQFQESLIKHFSLNNIHAAKESEADATVDVNIDYTRNFNYGGKALNKPTFSYQVSIKKKDIPVANYNVNNKTTNYGGFKDTAVNLEISAFKWGVEDEPKDVDLIASTIAKEVAAIGK